VYPGLERSVEEHARILREKPLREIEAATSAKRLRWLTEHAAHRRRSPLTPRSLFEILFFEYLGLRREDLPVVSESESQVTWLSMNACPTLEACIRLGLDTRTVCKGAYERSTQAFLSWFDPRFRFIRDYSQIRPHSQNCKEQIVRMEFEKLMRSSIAEARASLVTGNKGYGAAVVLGESVLSCRHDTAASEGDPSLHAEVNAIRDAVRAWGSADLSGGVLVSTCEPCPMCSSLAVWSNLSAIVFGASIEKTAALGRARILVSAREIVDRSPVTIEVIGGVLEEECLELYGAA